ncbi:MAG TPA: hypothetical protein DD979_01570 [Gammaproteobacteria bacterium]|nr:hypothetical protein [Gammaproteobacteria bacterium]
MTITLAACSVAPKIALQPEAKASIKTIALVDVPEPETYRMVPETNAAGSVLYMFGALGGAILGGIEASREKKASQKFTQAVAPLEPELSGTLLSELEAGLKSKGYQVVRVPMPAKDEESGEYDVASIDGVFDAVLVATVEGGYSAASYEPQPMLLSTVQMYDRTGDKMLFSNQYVYSDTQHGARSVHIKSESRFVLSSLDDLYSNVAVARDGMQAGAKAFAEHALAEL